MSISSFSFMRFRPLNRIEPKRHTLAIQPFTLSASWAGASELVASADILNTRPFSFKLPISSNSTYVLAVRWSISPYVYRYLLWNDVGELLNYPLYNGETIGVNAVFEAWNVSVTNTIIQPSTLLLPISWMNEPNICPRCFNNEYSTSFTLMPI